MVEKRALSQKIDSRLRSLKRHLEALPWYVERYGPDSAGEGQSGADLDALMYEWRDTLDRFEALHEWFLAGHLSDEQAERHRQNLLLLAHQIPAIRRLGLGLPSGHLAAALDTISPSPSQTRPA